MKKLLPITIVLVGVALVSFMLMKKKSNENGQHGQTPASAQNTLPATNDHSPSASTIPSHGTLAAHGTDAADNGATAGAGTRAETSVAVGVANSGKSDSATGASASGALVSGAPSGVAGGKVLPNIAGITSGAGSGSQPAADAKKPDGAKPDSAKLAVAKVEAPRCYRVSYKHKIVESHSDGEVCGHHKNLVHLPRAHAALASACVRVDSTPVKFETRSETDLVLDPVAGPESTISITYCVGDSCKPAAASKCQAVAKANVRKKDEFMEAIGGDADGKELGNWEGKAGGGDSEKKLNAALDPGIRREIAHLDDPKPKAPKDAGLFAGWELEQEEELKTCL